MPELDGGGLRMLLVADEDEDLREFVRIHLEGPALHVFEAADAVTALRLAKTVVPHVLLLGASLFGSAAGEAVGRLREDPDTAETRIVLVLGGADEAAGALPAGVDGCLVRPFGAPELVRVVEEVLGGRGPAN